MKEYQTVVARLVETKPEPPTVVRVKVVNTKSEPSPYQRHLAHLRGFGDGAGSRPMLPQYECDQDYQSGYITGQVAKRQFAEASAKALGLNLAEIKTQ